MARTYRRRLWVGPLLLASCFQGGCYLLDKKPTDVSKGDLVQPKNVDDAPPPAPPKDRPSTPQASRLPEPKPQPIAHIDELDDPVTPRGDLTQVAAVSRVPQSAPGQPRELSQNTPERPGLIIVKNVPPGDEVPELTGPINSKPTEQVVAATVRHESDLPLPADPGEIPRTEIHPRATTTTSGGRLDQPASDNRGGRNFEMPVKSRNDEELKTLEAMYNQKLEQRDEALRTSSVELQRATMELQKAREQIESSQRDITRLLTTNKELQVSLTDAVNALEKKVKDTPPAPPADR
jgi:hypothetical protein